MNRRLFEREVHKTPSPILLRIRNEKKRSTCVSCDSWSLSSGRFPERFVFMLCHIANELIGRAAVEAAVDLDND
jgi:hypothetical protein